jgi:photosystem II stability/assembly factor-like uncharacterized protein
MKRLPARLATVLSSLCLLISVVPSVRAEVPVLQWTEVDIPGDNDLTVVSPSEVTGIAAGRNGLVYAIDGEYGRMYRSLEYGLDWADITKYLERAGAILPATFVAVAPDNEGIVAVVTDGGAAVYVSLDGGYEWEDVHLPALSGDVTALAISAEYTYGDREYRDIAVAAASWSDGLSNGQVLVLQGGCIWGGWRDQEFRVDPLVVGADVSSLAFSPSYSRDHTLIVVASTGSDVDAAWTDRTWLVLGERDKSAGTTDWDEFAGYPLEIIGAGDAVGAVDVRSSLALPADFDSRYSESRTLFVSVDRTPDHDDDVYRVVEDDVFPPYGRMDVNGGSDIDIWSIAYRGSRTSGVLLAGERDPVAPLALKTQVRRCGNPFATSPDWEESEVEPTGPGHAVVAWAPNVSLGYCGTSSRPGAALDESAFSASTYGSLWRQMAIIDTSLTLTDLAVTPDGAKLFLTTSNPWGPESVWHGFSDPLGYKWERVLTVDSDTDAVMVRLSADYEDDNTVYVASHNSNLVAVSFNRGNSWEWRKGTDESLLDLLVVDAKTLYAAIPGGRIMLSTYGGKYWEDPVDTLLSEVNMLSRSRDGTLFAGSGHGYVSYSTDGGETWTIVDEPVGSGPVQVRPDSAYAENGWIYAASSVSDEGLWRWKVGTSIYWQQLDEDVTELGEGQDIGGLLCGDEGTLYALRIEPAGDDTGGMTRWLCPACESCADFEYDHVIEDLPAGASFEADAAFVTGYPVGTLWGNGVLNEVFTIDSAGQRIFLFRDTLCKRGPYLDAPVDGAHLDENPCDCNRDAVVTFDWEELDAVTVYEVSFYHEASLATWLWTTFSDYHGFVVSPSGDTSDFESGTTYGWRVRTVSPVLSPWSDMWRLYPRLLSVSGLQPAAGQTGVATPPIFTWNGPGMAAAYEFVLATDPGFANVVASYSGSAALESTVWVCDRELSSGTNYFWRVRSVSGEACSPWVESAFTTETPVSKPVSAGINTVQVPAQASAVGDYFIWAMFGLIALLLVGLIALTLRTARR